MVDLDSTQTLTNKTLTNPVISGLSNTTLTTPVINGVVTGTGTGYIGSLTAGTPGVMNPLNDDSTTTTAHGLGAIPALVVGKLECLSTDLGYAAGDVVFILSSVEGTDHGFVIYTDATNTYITMGIDVALIDKSTFNLATVDETKWKLTVIPYKLN